MAHTDVSIALKMRDQASAPMRRAMNQIGHAASTARKSITSGFVSIQQATDRATSRIFNLQNAIMGLAGAYGLSRLARSAIDTASSFEMMAVKLDALTKGRGTETLEEINKWALDMPINTEKAVSAFTMMMAMGLKPTTKEMQILVDTASIFGEQTLPRIARALGQMQTLGKLSAEELNQLSDAGIDARKYLGEFGMTLEELQKAVAEGKVPISAVIDTIWEGLNRDYGGAAAKAQNAWAGLIATFKSYITEIERTVMGAGVFDALKKHLKTVNTHLKNWLKNNEELIKQKVPIYVEWIETKVRSLWNFLSGISEMTYAAIAGGAIGGFLFGGPGAVILSALAAIDVKTEGLLRKTFNTEMTAGLIGGLLFGGAPGLIVGSLVMLDGYLGGPMLSKIKELTSSAIEYGKTMAEVWGPQLGGILEGAEDKWNTFEINCQLIFMRFKDRHKESINAVKTNWDNLVEHLKTIKLEMPSIEELKEATEKDSGFWGTMGELKDKFVELGEAISGVFKKFFNVVWPALKKNLASFGKLLAKITEYEINNFIDMISMNWIPAMEDGSNFIKDTLIPEIDALKPAFDRAGSGIDFMIGKVTEGINKLNDLLLKQRELRKELNKDLDANVKVTGSGSSTLPIMEKIAQIKEGLSSLSGQEAYHISFDQPSMPSASMMPSLIGSGSFGGADLWGQYEDIKKGLLITAEDKMKEFREDRRIIIDYINKRGMKGHFDISAWNQAMSAPYRRYGAWLKETKETYLEPLAEKIREYHEKLAKTLMESIDANIKTLGEQTSYIKPQATLPQSIPALSQSWPAREQRPAGMGGGFPSIRMPSIIINTGDLNVRAAADDPEAIKAIDEKLAELIRSGRSRIPSIFKPGFF
jgi:tape measure domain-containing protein